ncbi:MAG: ABC transporter substrate-binding protein [Actinomycetota bacterium]|nr:ABC transporter substrate-binding protein [Actinomycetota bacterium]
MTQKFYGRTNMPGSRLYNRRDFLKMGGVGLAGATLLGAAGCGGGGGGSFNGEITVGFGREASGTLQKLIDKFNKQNKDISAKWRVMPSDTGQYFDQLRTQFQAQDGSLTLIGGDVIWPAQFAANSYIIDLSDRFTEGMRSKFLQGPVESNTYQGKVYGVPWFTDAGLLYYRKDLLEKAGFSAPPKTWDELKDQAQKIMQDQGTKFGFVFQGAEYEGGTVNGLEYINSHGGQVLDPNDASKVVIDSPESVAGLETEHSMVTDGVSPQAVSTYAEPETEAPFLGGDAVFCRNWPYMYSLAGTENFIKPDLIDIAPLPAGEGGESVSGLGGWNFFINAFADTEAQDAAWEFVKYITAPEQQKFYALGGSYLPTLSALYNDPEIKENVPTVRLGAAALKNTVPRPVSPVYSDMSLKMAEEFNSSLGGDTSPQQAISSLQTELQKIADQSPS